MFRINVAQDFTKRPAGRYSTDGRTSGETFRDTLLIPKLKELINHNANSDVKERLYVDFTEVTMAGGSWLEEAFGGAVRVADIQPFGLFDLIVIIDRNADTKISETVREYINDEIARQENSGIPG